MRVCERLKMRQLCCTILLLLGFPSSWTNEKLKLSYSWKSLDFDFHNEHERETAIHNGTFIPNACIPIDVDVYIPASERKDDRKVFITIPRIQDGIPATLGWVNGQPEENPLIKPYPNWSKHNSYDCHSSAIISVFRVQIDEYNRLWVLDTGKVKETQVCSPKLHVFDLNTDMLIHEYSFPKNVYKEGSLFVTVAVDVRDSACGIKCTYAYIADVTGFALVVYDHEKSRSWRIDNNLFYPYPPYGTFNIAGSTFDLMDGILGLALGPMRNNDRVLYFHSLASKVEAHVNTSVIRNHDDFLHDSMAKARSFVAFEGMRSSQSAAEAMDRNGILFFGLLSNLTIACWNSNHCQYESQHHEILDKNNETLQFPSGMKTVTSKGNQQELWILSSSFQKFMTNSLNFNETNFRIHVALIDELTRNTKCASSSSSCSYQ